MWRSPVRGCVRSRPDDATINQTMVRPTVARIDLARARSPTTSTSSSISTTRRAAGDRPASSRSSRRTRTDTARVRWRGRSKQAGADLLACADIEEGAALRAAGVRADILVFGALSVSDLDGLFDCRLTPTISTPGAARAVQAAAAKYKQRVRYHLKIDTGMNRLGFRFDNLRRTLPRAVREPRTSISRRSTRTSRRPTIPSRRSSTSSACASTARVPRSGR